MRFVVVAVPARMADAGAGVGLVLLALSRLGTCGALIGGLLTAALTAPHLLGARAGRVLDRAEDARRTLAMGCTIYGTGVLLGVLALDVRQPWLAAVPLLVAGTCGPLLTGGMSTLVRRVTTDPARGRGVDSVTYGTAGTLGPALVAAVSGMTSPVAALLVVSALAFVSAVAVRTVPGEDRGATDHAGSASQNVDRRGGAGRLLLHSRPLRRVTLTTMSSAAAGSAAGIAAVLIGTDLTGHAARGAWLVAVLGVGNLAGSALVVLRPLRGEPVRAGLVLAAVLACGYLAMSVAATFALELAAYAAVGLITGPWVAATLAVRERYAPAGRRAETFAAMAGWKVAAGSAGAALAGVCAGFGGRTLMAVAAGVAALTVIAAWLDSDRTGAAHPSTP